MGDFRTLGIAEFLAGSKMFETCGKSPQRFLSRQFPFIPRVSIFSPADGRIAAAPGRAPVPSRPYPCTGARGRARSVHILNGGTQYLTWIRRGVQQAVILWRILDVISY